MIVRNEEARLDACLRSVVGVADEVVIVDTGSTDRPGYASLWVWLFYAALALEGPDAPEARLAEGIARHPRFPELRHCQMALAVLRWNDAVGRQGLYALTAQASLRHLPSLPQAARMLGLPLAFESHPPAAERATIPASEPDRGRPQRPEPDRATARP